MAAWPGGDAPPAARADAGAARAKDARARAPQRARAVARRAPPTRAEPEPAAPRSGGHRLRRPAEIAEESADPETEALLARYEAELESDEEGVGGLERTDSASLVAEAERLIATGSKQLGELHSAALAALPPPPGVLPPQRSLTEADIDRLHARINWLKALQRDDGAPLKHSLSQDNRLWTVAREGVPTLVRQANEGSQTPQGVTEVRAGESKPDLEANPGRQGAASEAEAS